MRALLADRTHHAPVALLPPDGCRQRRPEATKDQRSDKAENAGATFAVHMGQHTSRCEIHSLQQVCALNLVALMQLEDMPEGKHVLSGLIHDQPTRAPARQ
jgi:hypothetical protein